MKIDSTTGEFTIYKAITRFNNDGAILTLLDENESNALTIEVSHAEASLIEHELANIIIILKMRSRLTDNELRQYKRVVDASGVKLLGESKGGDDE